METTTLRRFSVTALALGAIALGACGGSDNKTAASTTTGKPTYSLAPTADTPRCDKVFVDGKTITAAKWAAGCTADDGSFVISMSLGYDCGTVWSNAYGWGYEGGTFHAGETMPDAEVVSKCGAP